MGVAEQSKRSISNPPLRTLFVGGGYGATGVIEIVYESCYKPTQRED